MVHRIYMHDYKKGICRKFIWVQQIANELNFKKNVSKDMVLKKKRTTGNGLYKLGKRVGIDYLIIFVPHFPKSFDYLI